MGFRPDEELHCYVIGGTLRVVRVRSGEELFGSLSRYQELSDYTQLRDRSDKV